VRRSICLLSVIAAGAAAPVAFAQDAQVAADAGAPTATASVAASATAPAATSAASASAVPTVKPALVATPPRASKSSPAPEEQEVYQLGRIVELEADRARGRRYVGSSLELVGAGGIIASGAFLFTLNTSGIDATLIQVLGGVEIGLGAAMGVDAILSLMVESPMERMFDAYAPIAVDKSLTARERLHRGEALLESMANRERAARLTGIAGSVVSVALSTALGIWLVADNDFWGTSDPNTDAYRALVGTLVGLGVVSAIGDAIAKVLWERGPAELAWEHWHLAHEPASVRTSRVQFRPYFAPIVGGVTAGASVRF
jgi:hypothetical protein